MKFFVALFAVAITSVCIADSWSPPTVLTIASTDGDTLVRVTPRRDDALPQALVFDYDAQAEVYVLRSKFALRNRMSPYRLAVSPQGKRIIAVEEYGSLGYGRDSVVVYDGSGHLLWRWSLSDIFTKDEIARIPTSTSSRWWIEGVTVVRQSAGYVAVIFPPRDRPEKPIYDRIWIDLETGKLTRG